MSDRFHHPSQAVPKTLHNDHEIATALDAQFCFFRIGHAAIGSHGEVVLERARWIGALIEVLDK